MSCVDVVLKLQLATTFLRRRVVFRLNPHFLGMGNQTMGLDKTRYDTGREDTTVGYSHTRVSFFFLLLFIWRCRFFREFFCTISAFTLYGEYVVRFFLPDGVFLSCDHELDFLTSAYVRIQSLIGYECHTARRDAIATHSPVRSRYDTTRHGTDEAQLVVPSVAK